MVQFSPLGERKNYTNSAIIEAAVIFLSDRRDAWKQDAEGFRRVTGSLVSQNLFTELLLSCYWSSALHTFDL